MIVVASLEALVLLAVAFLLMRHHAQSEQAWTQERRELLNRIQRPEHVPTVPRPDFVLPEPEPDEIALVGHVADPPEED